MARTHTAHISTQPRRGFAPLIGLLVLFATGCAASSFEPSQLPTRGPAASMTARDPQLVQQRMLRLSERSAPIYR